MKGKAGKKCASRSKDSDYKGRVCWIQRVRRLWVAMPKYQRNRRAGRRGGSRDGANGRMRKWRTVAEWETAQRLGKVEATLQAIEKDVQERIGETAGPVMQQLQA